MLREESYAIIDKLLLWAAVAVLLVLTLVQSAIAIFPQTGVYLNTALRLEGEPIRGSGEEMVRLAGEVRTIPWASVTLKLLDYVSLPDVKVLVDGKEVAAFLRNEVTINVKHGNVISVYNPHTQLKITVIVSKSTSSILEPAVNNGVNGMGYLYFSPVIVK